MPNHVTNEITIDGTKEQIKQVLDSIQGKDSRDNVMAIDFNKIIPTPPNIFQGNLGEAERKKYGRNNWYDWNRDNWGTKWNAYDTRAEFDVVTFDTAWAHPFPVILALSNKFPEVTFHVRFADEDTGHNLGDYVIKAGEELEDNSPEEGTEEAIKFACDVKGYDYEEYLEDMEA